MLLPQIVVHGPGHVLVGLNVEAEHLILEAIEGLRLLSAIRDPVVQRNDIIELVVQARTHVIEGQKVKPIRAGVIHLIFGIVALQAQGTGPFSKVHGESRANRHDVRAISLEDRAIDIRPRLIGSVPLERGGRLSILQVEAEAKPFAD